VKRAFSLKGRNAFKEVYQKGKRYQKQGIQIIVLHRNHIKKASQEDSAVKMGISIGRRYGKAHNRNRAKRQVRAIWHENLKNMKSSFYIIVRLGEASNLLDYNEKKNILPELLRRAGVLGI
jgi:ribonuclease P protein component